MSNLVLLDQLQSGIVILTLNRPDRRNALSIELMERLISTLEQLATTGETRVAILRGAGPVFCAGLDLREASDASLATKSAHAVAAMLKAVSETPLITIAAMHGGAFAGGGGLMAACDIVVAAEDAQIGFPEARRGLLPALITDVLRRKVGEGDLRELLLTGDPIDATRAQQLGLVQRLALPGQELDTALTMARSILEGGPQTIRDTKRMLNQTASLTGNQLTEALLHWHEQARCSDEATEGLAAFGEKRSPSWQQTTLCAATDQPVGNPMR
jgi:methylglutaconyl-CoA hydratase